MLVLYETALGFCLFKLTDTAKLEKADLWEEFESPERANKLYVSVNVCARNFGFNFFGPWPVHRNVKVKASCSTSIYIHRDGRRRNYRDPGRKNREGPEKILVRGDRGEG